MAEGNLYRKALTGANHRLALIFHSGGKSAVVTNIEGEAAPAPEGSGIAFQHSKSFFFVVAGLFTVGGIHIVHLQHSGNHRKNLIGESSAGFGNPGRKMTVDADLHNPVANVLLPISGDSGSTANNAQNSTQSTAGAVGVIAAVDGIDHRLFEVALTVKQADDHKGHIGRCLEPAQVLVGFYQQIPGIPVGGLLVVFCQHQPDRLGYTAAFGDVSQRGFHDFPDVRFHEGNALQRGGEYLSIHALAHTVIHRSIHNGILDGHIGVAGSQAGPDFGTDPSAVGMLPLIVIKFAGQRRQQAQGQILLANAVFVPLGGDHQLPALCQGVGIEVLRSETLHHHKPGHLQIQIVIGQGLTLGGVIALDVVHFCAALVGAAHGSANILADPASQDLVPQGIVIINCFIHTDTSKIISIYSFSVKTSFTASR